MPGTNNLVQSHSRIVPSGSQQVLRQKIRLAGASGIQKKFVAFSRLYFRFDDGRNEDPATASYVRTAKCSLSSRD